MPTMTIDHNYFTSHAEVMQDIATTGFWPTTYVSGQSPELPVHHHDYDIIGYVLEGSSYLLDENEQRVEIKAGDRLNIPKGAWHAEGAVTSQMTYIVTVSEPIGLMQALMPLEPRGPMPDFSQLNINV
ncbi:MAG: cupin domain-containing protein [Pseudomonadota bacterium]